MLAARITLAHFSVSATMKFPKFAGDIGSAAHPSTAAILVLAFTVGTWVLSFVAAFQGGMWEQIAGYTPSEMLQAFRRGLVRPRPLITTSMSASPNPGQLPAVARPQWRQLDKERRALADDRNHR
jgi:hypothetical protein